MIVDVLVGDINLDGEVGFADFLILSNHFGLEMATADQGDVDGNGSVGFSDFLLVSGNYGQSLNAIAAHVPAPTTGFIGITGLFAELPPMLACGRFTPMRLD